MLLGARPEGRLQHVSATSVIPLQEDDSPFVFVGGITDTRTLTVYDVYAPSQYVILPPVVLTHVTGVVLYHVCCV